MRIIPAGELKKYLTPHPRTAGVFFLERDGHLITVYDDSAPPTSAQSVQRLLDEFDASFPIHGVEWTANLTVLCLPHTLTFLDQDQHPTQRADGEVLDDLLVLSAGLVGDKLREVVTHEIVHLWQNHHDMRTNDGITPRWQEFADIAGIDLALHPVNDPVWQKRRQELFAEHLSAALWDAPLASMTPLSPGQYVRLARWALRLTPRKRTITLPIGNNIATVDGRAVTLDQPAVVDKTTNRTLVPARFVVESLGCRVDWDGEKREVLITQEVVKV